MDSAHYPTLFRSADLAARNSQKMHFRLLRADIVCKVLGAALAAGSAAWLDAWSVFVALGVLVAGTLIALASRSRRYEEAWWGARAAAETVKSLAWRYMTRTRPLDASDTGRADNTLIDHLRETLKEARNVAAVLAEAMDGDAQITPQMREVRELDLDGRCSFFDEHRAREQQSWYADRAREHASAESAWFWLSFAAQILAASACLVGIHWPGAIGAVAVVTTAAASATTWSKARQFRTLASAYTVAAHELSLLRAQREHVLSERDLARWVNEIEEAISREHTLWRARSRA